MVGIAQLVERRVVVADVAGSSPVTHPRLPTLTGTNALPLRDEVQYRLGVPDSEDPLAGRIEVRTPRVMVRLMGG